MRETQDSDTPPERRGEPRLPICRPVRIKSASSAGFIEAATVNISESGMLLQTARIPAGESFDFILTLNDFDPIEGRAELMYLSFDEAGGSTSMGVQFLDLKGEGDAILRQLLAEHLAGEVAASDPGA